MTATTAEKPRAKRVHKGWRFGDFKRYANGNYREPHPSVWATETVKRDEWEVVTYRRPIGTSRIQGTVIAYFVEQHVGESDARLVSETSDSIDLGGDAAAISERLNAITSSMNDRMRMFEAYTVDARGRTIRPGVLEALSEAMGVADDDELAAALGGDRLFIDLLRAGFSVYGNPLHHDIERKLEELGIAGGSWHAHRIMVPRITA